MPATCEGSGHVSGFASSLHGKKSFSFFSTKGIQASQAGHLICPDQTKQICESLWLAQSELKWTQQKACCSDRDLLPLDFCKHKHITWLSPFRLKQARCTRTPISIHSHTSYTDSDCSHDTNALSGSSQPQQTLVLILVVMEMTQYRRQKVCWKCINNLVYTVSMKAVLSQIPWMDGQKKTLRWQHVMASPPSHLSSSSGDHEYLFKILWHPSNSCCYYSLEHDDGATHRVTSPSQRFTIKVLLYSEVTL